MASPSPCPPHSAGRQAGTLAPGQTMRRPGRRSATHVESNSLHLTQGWVFALADTAGLLSLGSCVSMQPNDRY